MTISLSLYLSFSLLSLPPQSPRLIAKVLFGEFWRLHMRVAPEKVPAIAIAHERVPAIAYESSGDCNVAMLKRNIAISEFSEKISGETSAISFSFEKTSGPSAKTQTRHRVGGFVQSVETTLTGPWGGDKAEGERSSTALDP